jgi:hypothetical protein
MCGHLGVPGRHRPTRRGRRRTRIDRRRDVARCRRTTELGRRRDERYGHSRCGHARRRRPGRRRPWRRPSPGRTGENPGVRRRRRRTRANGNRGRHDIRCIERRVPGSVHASGSDRVGGPVRALRAPDEPPRRRGRARRRCATRVRGRGGRRRGALDAQQRSSWLPERIARHLRMQLRPGLRSRLLAGGQLLLGPRVQIPLRSPRDPPPDGVRSDLPDGRRNGPMRGCAPLSRRDGHGRRSVYRLQHRTPSEPRLASVGSPLRVCTRGLRALRVRNVRFGSHRGLRRCLLHHVPG